MLFVTYTAIFLFVRFCNLHKAFFLPLTPQGLIKRQYKIILSKYLCFQIDFGCSSPPLCKTTAIGRIPSIHLFLFLSPLINVVKLACYKFHTVLGGIFNS